MQYCPDLVELAKAINVCCFFLKILLYWCSFCAETEMLFYCVFRLLWVSSWNTVLLQISWVKFNLDHHFEVGLTIDDQIMLGSPSFHSYRDANNGKGKPNLELGNGIYYEDQPCSVCSIPIVFCLYNIF